MKSYNHDFEGTERDQHLMNISCDFDGDLLWIRMNGAHSWEDGQYTHAWLHAMRLKTFQDLITCATRAVWNYVYLTEVVPQFEEEIGDTSLMDW